MKSFIKQFNTSNGFIPMKENTNPTNPKQIKEYKPLFIHRSFQSFEISVSLEGSCNFDHLYVEKFMSLEENEVFFMEILKKQKNEKFSLSKDILTEISYNKANKNSKEFNKFLTDFDEAPNRFVLLENRLTADNVLILINNKFLNYNNTSDFYIIKINAELFKETSIVIENSDYTENINSIEEICNYSNNGLVVDPEIVNQKNIDILKLKEEICYKLNKAIELDERNKKLLEAFDKIKIKLKKTKIACSNDKKISILEQEKLSNKMKSLINSYEDQLSILQNKIAKNAVNESNKFTVESVDQYEIIEKADSEENNIGGNFICVICLSNKRNCCFIDCGHLLCCFECSLNNDPNYTLKTLKLCINEYNVTNGAIVCPLCKRLNKKYRKIFF